MYAMAKLIQGAARPRRAAEDSGAITSVDVSLQCRCLRGHGSRLYPSWRANQRDLQRGPAILSYRCGILTPCVTRAERCWGMERD